MMSLHPSTCRLCLTNKDVTVNIFKYQFHFLPKMIHCCLSIRVAENDRLPKYICQTCYSKVTLFYEFRNHALQAQQHLMSVPVLNSVSQNLYPQAQQHFMSMPTTYNDYVPENSYACDQQEYEDLNCISNNHAETFCEVVETNNLTISSETETCATDPLLHGSISDNHSCNSSQNLPRRESDGRAENARNQSTKVEAANDCQRQRYNVTANTRTQSIKTKRPIPSRRQSKEAKGNGKTQPVKTEPLNNSTEERNGDDTSKSETQLVKTETKSLSLSKDNSPVPASLSEVGNKDEDEESLPSGEESKYSCDKCHFTTNSKSRYTMHSKRHVRKYIVFCKECNISFLNKTEMTNHNIEKHDAEKFQCAHCNDVFTSKNTLYSHIKSHDPSNVHICEICGKTYKKKNSYKRHINRNHLGTSAKAQCAICERMLSSKEHLRRHMLVHTDERNWVCATCGKCYRSKCYLTEHTRIHAGIKPYKCEICGKCFTQRGSLTIHKRSHTGERPFRCEYCDRGFIISTLLRYHMKKCSLAPRNNVRVEPVSVITSNSSVKITQQMFDANY